MRDFTAEEMREMLDPELVDRVNTWLARGDGIAVYENEDMGHAQLGHRRFCSFGSDQAQFVDPPDRLPDFPGQVNWRYRLVGVYRSAVLVPGRPHAWVKPTAVLDLICAAWDERLVEYSMATAKFAHGPSHVQFRLLVTESGQPPVQVNDALVGPVTVVVSAWTDDRGMVDRLAPFTWLVTRPDGDNRSGEDPNLGAAIVGANNATTNAAS